MQTLEKTVNRFEKNQVKYLKRPSDVRRILKRFIKRPPRYLIYDVEATGFDPWVGTTWCPNEHDEPVMLEGARVFCFGMGIFDEKQEILYCLFIHLHDRLPWKLALELLDNPNIMKVGHYLNYDLKVSYKSDIPIRGKIWDTLTATRLTHDREQSHKLKYLGPLFAGRSTSVADRYDVELKEWLKRARAASTRAGNAPGMVNYSFVPLEIMVPYVLGDIFYTFLIFQMLEDEINETYKLPFALEIKYINVVFEMERRGVQIDRELCVNAESICHGISVGLLRKLRRKASEFKLSGFLPGSHAQVKRLCHALGATEEEMTNKKGEYSSDAYVLKKLIGKGRKYKFLQNLLNYRTACKRQTSYFGSMYLKSSEEGILHCNIKPSDTATGRSAVVEPALQTIPRPGSDTVEGIPSVRSVFIPREDFDNWYFDYSQVEMRMFALFAQEPAMLDAINSGRDLHNETADLMFGDVTKENRQKAKAVNFGIIFGMGVDKLASELGITKKEAKELMSLYYGIFPGVNRLVTRCKSLIASQGYVEDMFGRRYHIPMEKAYVAVNSLIQGSAANALKLAILQVANLLRRPRFMGRAFILLPVHDELQMEIKHKETASRHDTILPMMIKLAMEEILPIRQYGMTTLVDVARTSTNWEEKKDVEFSNAEMQRARQLFTTMHDKIVVQYDHPKVDWFMREDDDESN